MVTADDKFYYGLLSLSIDLGWSIRRARNLLRATEHLSAHPPPIVIYDKRLPYLRLARWHPCPGLGRGASADSSCDAANRRRDLADVIDCEGYDAIERFARKEEWVRMLRFAWLACCGPVEEPDCLPAIGAVPNRK